LPLVRPRRKRGVARSPRSRSRARRRYAAGMARVLQGEPRGQGRRVGVAVARFNEVVTEKLLDGALATLRQHGVADGDVSVVWVPGAFELPAACRALALAGGVDALVVLGAVVRGGTDHYEHVCRAVTDGAMRASLELDVGIGFGVLTCATMEQALARAGGEHGNKGSDAAIAALVMADLRAQLRLSSRPPAG
jgi:6,7-dimethyl-8-ribityllumazine synthase